MVQHSTFSKKSQFTVLMTKNEVFRSIYSFNAHNHSLSILKVKGKASKRVERLLGIPIDGTLSFPDAKEEADTENLVSLLFHYSQKETHLTYYDIMQMAFLGYTIPKESVLEHTITLPVAYNEDLEQNLIELFSDDQIKSDDKSIQIINATNVSGIGSQLEWVISHIGGHVVAVSTSQKPQKHSSISYGDTKSYTVSRLEKLLGIQASNHDEKGISDIIIVVGEDKKNLSFLH